MPRSRCVSSAVPLPLPAAVSRRTAPLCVGSLPDPGTQSPTQLCGPWRRHCFARALLSAAGWGSCVHGPGSGQRARLPLWPLLPLTRTRRQGKHSRGEADTQCRQQIARRAWPVSAPRDRVPGCMSRQASPQASPGNICALVHAMLHTCRVYRQWRIWHGSMPLRRVLCSRRQQSGIMPPSCSPDSPQRNTPSGELCSQGAVDSP